MACKADYSNTQKYSNRKLFDGQPVPDGKVLVPFLKFGLQKGEYIQDNFTTMHLGEFSFEIEFMAISEDHYASYMKDFCNELNKDIEMRRDGRCIIGKNPDSSDNLCLTSDAVRAARTKAFWNVSIRSVWKSWPPIMSVMAKPLTSKIPLSCQ